MTIMRVNLSVARIDDCSVCFVPHDIELHDGIRCAHGQRLRRAAPVMVTLCDPPDVEYDGATLRQLISADEGNRRELEISTSFGPIPVRAPLTSRQRAAVSAHWSAELRAKVAEGRDRERHLVTVDTED